MKYSDRVIDNSIKLVLLEPIVNQKTKVLVRCHCGLEYKIYPQTLFRENKILECKLCSSKRIIKGFEEIGGLRKHPAYNVLDAMKQRCYNKKHESYLNYGGLGISVCNEWLDSYVNFCVWADSTGYNKNLTIDRINPNGNYEPDNCRWVSKSVQKENKHIQRNNTSGFTGVSFQKNINKWFSYVWTNGKRISCGYFNIAEEAHNARIKKIEELDLKYKRVNR